MFDKQSLFTVTPGAKARLASKLTTKKATSEQAAAIIPGSIYKIYPGAPHGLPSTHKDQLNADLLAFLKK